MINYEDDLDLILRKINKSILEICYIIKKNNPIDLTSVLGKDGENDFLLNKLYNSCIDILNNNLKDISSIKYISYVNSKDFNLCNEDGIYLISIDPIYNLKNLDSLIETGTIFCIFEFNNNEITSGNNIVMAGYSLYNIYTQLIICKYGKTDIYELSLIDEKWKLIYSNYKIKDKGSIYSINESFKNKFDINLKKTINSLISENYKFSWSMSILSDFNKIFIKSGILIVLNGTSDEINLVHHAFPLSYIMEKSNGLSYHKESSVINLYFPFNDIQKKISIFLGSEYEMFLLIDKFNNKTN